MKKIISILVLVFGLVGSMFAENPFRKQDYVVETSDVIDGVEYKFIGYKSGTAASWDLEKWLLESYDDLFPKQVYGLYDGAWDAACNKYLKGQAKSTKTSELMLKYDLNTACKVQDLTDGYYITIWFFWKKDGKIVSCSTLIEH